MKTTDNRPWFLRPLPPAPRQRSLSFDPERNRLTITEDGHTARYALDRIAGADCEAYTLVCLSDDEVLTATVQLAGRQSECDCTDSMRFGHKRQCSHIGALLTLKKLGRI